MQVLSSCVVMRGCFESKYWYGWPGYLCLLVEEDSFVHGERERDRGLRAVLPDRVLLLIFILFLLYVFTASMLSTNTTLPTGQLRAKLEGANLPAGFKLPELELVLQDAAQGELQKFFFWNGR